MAETAALPTYSTIADVLEKKNGSGWRLAGWTVARTFLIAPPMMIAGVSPKRAFLGAALASGLISVFTLMRIYNAGVEKQLSDAVRAKGRRRRAPRRLASRRR